MITRGRALSWCGRQREPESRKVLSFVLGNVLFAITCAVVSFKECKVYICEFCQP